MQAGRQRAEKEVTGRVNKPPERKSTAHSVTRGVIKLIRLSTVSFPFSLSISPPFSVMHDASFRLQARCVCCWLIVVGLIAMNFRASKPFPYKTGKLKRHKKGIINDLNTKKLCECKVAIKAAQFCTTKASLYPGVHAGGSFSTLLLLWILSSGLLFCCVRFRLRLCERTCACIYSTFCSNFGKVKIIVVTFLLFGAIYNNQI